MPYSCYLQPPQYIADLSTLSASQPVTLILFLTFTISVTASLRSSQIFYPFIPSPNPSLFFYSFSSSSHELTKTLPTFTTPSLLHQVFNQSFYPLRPYPWRCLKEAMPTSCTPCTASRHSEASSCSSSWSDSTTCSAATDTATATVMSWPVTLPRARLGCVDGGGDADVCVLTLFFMLYYIQGMFPAWYNM